MLSGPVYSSSFFFFFKERPTITFCLLLCVCVYKVMQWSLHFTPKNSLVTLLLTLPERESAFFTFPQTLQLWLLQPCNKPPHRRKAQTLKRMVMLKGLNGCLMHPSPQVCGVSSLILWGTRFYLAETISCPSKTSPEENTLCLSYKVYFLSLFGVKVIL